MIQQEAINKWNELNIQRCEMPFSCGGDSMGDWDFNFYDNENNLVVADVLKEFFNEDVFRQVDFYVDSDGYYQGESGTVEITLSDDDDEPNFEYVKSAQLEFSETHVSTMEITLTPDMVEYINENVSNINGSNDGIAINYKRDFILTPKQVELETELEALIENETRNYSPDELDEIDDWYSFTTNLGSTDDDEMTSNSTPVIKGNKLLARMSNQYTDYRDSE